MSAAPFRLGEGCLRPLVLERGGGGGEDVEAIGIKSYLSRAPKNVGEKMVQSAVAALKEDLYKLPNRLDVEVYDVTGRAAGSGVWVDVTARLAPSGAVITAAARAPGYAGASPADTGAAAAAEFLRALKGGAAIDEATLALMVPYMALAEGVSVVALGDLGCDSSDAEGGCPRARAVVEVVGAITGARFEVGAAEKEEKEGKEEKESGMGMVEEEEEEEGRGGGGRGRRRVLRCSGIGYRARLGYSVPRAVSSRSRSPGSSSNSPLKYNHHHNSHNNHHHHHHGHGHGHGHHSYGKSIK